MEQNETVSGEGTAGGTLKTVGVYERPARGLRAPSLLLRLALLLVSVVVSALVISWIAS